LPPRYGLEMEIYFLFFVAVAVVAVVAVSDVVSESK
jgi:hypothetical protein